MSSPNSCWNWTLQFNNSSQRLPPSQTIPPPSLLYHLFWHFLPSSSSSFCFPCFDIFWRLTALSPHYMLSFTLLLELSVVFLTPLGFCCGTLHLGKANSHLLHWWDFQYSKQSKNTLKNPPGLEEKNFIWKQDRPSMITHDKTMILSYRGMQLWEMVGYTNYLLKSVEVKGELLEGRVVNTKGGQDVKKRMNNWIEVHDPHPHEEELVWLSFKKVVIRNSGENSSRSYTRLVDVQEKKPPVNKQCA